MNSPSSQLRVGHEQQGIGRSSDVRKMKTPLSPSNVDPGNQLDDTGTITPTLYNIPQMKSTAAPKLTELLVRQTQSNSENQILNSVALLVDSLKIDSSHQHPSINGTHDRNDGDERHDQHRRQHTHHKDTVSPLASPAVSPHSYMGRDNNVSQSQQPSRAQVDAQTLLDVAKFVKILQTNEKTAPVGQELDEIVKSLSDDSMDYIPKANLSPETLDALSMFIDHLSKNDSRNREIMPPIQVYVPAKSESLDEDISRTIANEDDDTSRPLPAAVELQSVQTQDLDPEVIYVLGQYIDAVAASPRPALSCWGLDPPSLRQSESEIVFQSRSEETELSVEAGTDSLPTPVTGGGQRCSIAAASVKHILQSDIISAPKQEHDIFTFNSMDESAPRALSRAKENPRQVQSARARQDPGGALAHTMGMSEHRHTEDPDLLPALARLRLTSGLPYHSTPCDAPTDVLSQADTLKDDPPLLLSVSKELRRRSGEPEYNLNKKYWTETELKTNKLRKQPESPRKKAMKYAVTDHPICPDPALSVCGLQTDYSGEQSNQRQELSEIEHGSPLVVELEQTGIDDANSCIMEQAVIENWADNVIVQESSSVLAACGPIVLEVDNYHTPNTFKTPVVRTAETVSDNGEKASRDVASEIEASAQHVDECERRDLTALKHHVSWKDETNVKDETEDLLMTDETTFLLRQIYKLLTDNGQPSESDINGFRILIRLAFPYYETNSHPNAIERARIQVQARRKHVPITLTNAFLEILQTLTDTESALGIHCSLESLSTGTIVDLLNRLLNVKQAQSSRDVAIYSLAGVGSQEGEAVEVDLHGHFGFARKDYGEADEILSDGEPWWEASAKLVRQSEKRDTPLQLSVLAPPPASLDSSSDGSTLDEDSTKKPVGLEDDIKGFWQGRKQRRKRRYGRATSRPNQWPVNEPQLAMSYSVTDNESSLRSKSSSSSGFTGTSAATIASDENVWIRKRSYALWPHKHSNKLQMWMSGKIQTDLSVEAPVPINAVDSVAFLDRPKLVRRGRLNVPGTRQWKRTYQLRTQAHPGYFDVDVNSLFAFAAVQGFPHTFDDIPWERREVRQRFLFEQSISYNRNWFGVAHKVYGNDTILEPVCFPRSMEMPTKAEEWTQEWYTKPMPTLLSQSTGDSKEANEMREIRRKYLIDDEFETDPDPSNWEETPECGKIRNVKLKIGERVSRVTPDLTSSLRRSRWRKKHFPKGTFPY